MKGERGEERRETLERKWEGEGGMEREQMIGVEGKFILYWSERERREKPKTILKRGEAGLLQQYWHPALHHSSQLLARR